jgi:hypothetical protein
MARLLRDTGMIHVIVQLQSLVGDFADGSLQVDEVDALLQQIAAEQGELSDANGLPEALVDCLWRATTVGAATATQADDAVEEVARRLERLGTLVQHLHVSIPSSLKGTTSQFSRDLYRLSRKDGRSRRCAIKRIC